MDKQVFLNNMLHEQEDENFTICGEWWGDGSDGFAVMPIPSDSGVTECPYCKVFQMAHVFAESLFSTPIRGMDIDQHRLIESEGILIAIQSAENAFGSLDQPDGSMTGYYRWIGSFVCAVHEHIENAKKAIAP